MLLITEINGFFKTLVIILLVYFTLRFLLRLAWPYILKYITKKAGQQMENVLKGFQDQSNNTTHNTQKAPKEPKEVVGEYIDYEEID